MKDVIKMNSCPADNPDHGSIHINYDSDTGK